MTVGSGVLTVLLSGVTQQLFTLSSARNWAVEPPSEAACTPELQSFGPDFRCIAGTSDHP